MRQSMKRAVNVALLTSVFVAGYLFATVTHPTAEAQMGDLGKKAMEAAGESGGSLGAAAKLGTSISEMRDHLTALNKDVDTLEKIKTSLVGGK
jgi:hypothetical protein